MSSNYCVCCGEEIPEGSWVCKKCILKTRGNEDVNLDYIKAAEADIRNLPYLKKSKEMLEKRRSFILLKNDGKADAAPPDFDDPYISERKINGALNDALALAEISAEIISADHEIEMIERTLGLLPEDERTVLIMFFQQGMNANQIGEKMYFESEKTVYRIRNRALYHYCLLYYGISCGKK